MKMGQQGSALKEPSHCWTKPRVGLRHRRGLPLLLLEAWLGQVVWVRPLAALDRERVQEHQFQHERADRQHHT